MNRASFPFLTAVLLLLAILPVASVSAEPDNAGSSSRSLIVLPLAPTGVDESVAASLNDLLAVEIEATNLFEVTAQRDLEAMLSQVELKQLLGEEDEGQLAAVGKRLQAQYLLRGSIGQVGATYLLSLTLIDVAEAKAVRRVKQILTGDPDGLVGSLHAAVVALALEEEGIAPSLTAGLIESMNIARKEKTFFLRFGIGYEVPVGPSIDSGDLAYIRPNLMTLSLSGAWQALPWLQVIGETGVGLSILDSFSMQNKQLVVRNIDDATNADGSTAWERDELVSTTHFDYDTFRIPVLLMARFQPEKGRLLPYFSTGLGISYQRYKIGDERLQVLDSSYATESANYPCIAPYAPDAEYGNCLNESTLRPGDISIDEATNEIVFSASDTIDFINLQFPVSVGIDYLISHHFGIGFDIRYTLTYSVSKTEGDMAAEFYQERDPYHRDGVRYYPDIEDLNHYYGYGDGEAREIVLDTVPIPRLHHGIGVTAGVFYYF